MTFRYPETESNALSNISLHLPKVATLGVVAPTGSGKTTLMHLLLKMYPVPEQSIYIGGKDITEIPAKAVRTGRICTAGRLFCFLLPSVTTSNFINREQQMKTWCGRRSWPVCMMILQHFRMDMIHRWANGERTYPVVKKQRIALARALIRNPQLLILDDTLSAVDNHTEQQILARLSDYYDGKTTVIVSHRLSAVKHAREIILLKMGRLKKEGPTSS